MKKQYIVLLLLLFSSSILFAQVEKGKWLLACYSNLGLDIGKYKWESSDGGIASEYKYTEFNVSPMAGYFVIDKLAAGLFMDYQYYKDVATDDNDTYKENSFIIGPFAKYYIMEYKHIWPFVGAGIGFGSGKYGWDGSDEYKWKILNYRIGAGAAYFLNDNVGLELSLGYNYYAEKYDNTEEAKSANASDNKDYSGGLKVSLGFVVTIGK
jgi:outer membrane protein